MNCICQCRQCLLEAEPYIDELQCGVPPSLLPCIRKWGTLRRRHVRLFEGSGDELRSKSHAAWCRHTGEPSELAAAAEQSTGIAQDGSGEASITICFYPWQSTTNTFALSDRPAALYTLLCFCGNCTPYFCFPLHHLFCPDTTDCMHVLKSRRIQRPVRAAPGHAGAAPVFKPPNTALDDQGDDFGQLPCRSGPDMTMHCIGNTE